MRKSPRHEIASDARKSPQLREELGSLRGGMVQAAEKRPLPARFTAQASPTRPSYTITDSETGKSATVPLFAYGEVREALASLFS